jgi:mannosyltransferase
VSERAGGLARLGPGQAVVLLTLLAAAIRFGTLDVQSIWLDESATMVLVRRSFGGMLSHLTSSESAPPLYYVLVWLWTRILGVGPLGFRSFSALVGTITVPVMYLAGRTISPRAGVLAALLTTVSPVMFYYSQESRTYGLLVLFAALAFVYFQWSLEAANSRHLNGWAAFSALALLTHYFAVFLFLPEAVLLARRWGWRAVAARAGGVCLVGAALVPLAAAQRGGGKASWIEAESLPARFAESVKHFAVGLSAPLQVLAAPLIVLIASAAVVLLWRRAGGRARALAAPAAFVAACGIGLPLLLAATHLVDVYDGRNVIATWVPLTVLVCAGLGAKETSRLGLLLAGALSAISLAAIVAVNVLPAYQRDNWRGAASTLGVPQGPRLIVGPEFSSLPLSIYIRGLTKARRAEAVTEVDFVALRAKHSTSAPSPPSLPKQAPAGFHLAAETLTSSYGVARYTSPHPLPLGVAALEGEARESSAEVSLQR